MQFFKMKYKPNSPRIDHNGRLKHKQAREMDLMSILASAVDYVVDLFLVWGQLPNKCDIFTL